LGSYAIFKHRLDYIKRIDEELGEPVKVSDIPPREVKWEQLIDDLSEEEPNPDEPPSPQR
jgi:hypothetical protein